MIYIGTSNSTFCSSIPSGDSSENNAFCDITASPQETKRFLDEG